MTTPDLVIPLRQDNSGAYNELKYSLRGWDTHVSGVEEVWLLGGKPRWVTGVNHIPLKQTGTKYQNVRRMLKHACLDTAISDPFIWSNDDIVPIADQRMRRLQMLHGGDACQYLMRMKARVGNSSYVQGGCKTVLMLESMGYQNPLAWSLHTPILVHKEPMLRAIEMVGDVSTPYHLRTLYGNLAGLRGTKHVDVKIVGMGLPHRSWPYVSTSDTSFQTKPVGQHIRDRFKHPSRWER